MFIQRTTFDRYGRTFQQFAATDPIAGEEFNYNAYGYLNQVIEAGSSANATYVYRAIIAMDARGNITEEIKGGITITRGYHPDTGRIMGISALAGFVQNLGYDFDVAGNLTARTDLTNTNNLSEVFTYDILNRLKTSTSRSNQTVINSLSLSYDDNGNILTKSNVEGGAPYEYLGAGPHAVTRIGSLTYRYDANGNMESGAGRTITYTAFNKPSSIIKDGHSTAFMYDPNHSRFKRTDTTGGQTTTTVYVGNVERITKPGGVIETKRYIGNTNIVTTTSTNPSPVELTVFTDHLGSTYALINRLTGESQYMSFDAFGLRRNDNWLDMSGLQLLTFSHSNSTRGYTGLEQLDEVGLIHMNGRVYDPLIGRFLSPDRFVQSPRDSQSYNRYSYVFNNPLSYTDPSGYFSLGNLIGGIVGAVLGTIFCGGNVGCGIQAWSIITSVSAEVSGRVDAMMNESSRFAGVSGRAFSNNFGEQSGLNDINAHNSSSDTSAKVATVGATHSDVTGGSFANGAASFAFDIQEKPGQSDEEAAEIVLDVAGTADPTGIVDGAQQDAADHYARNAENDQFFKDEGLYGRNDLTIDEVRDAGDYGMKQVSASETAYHRIGEGNENNIKLTSKIAHKESFHQRNWSNRYGRYEIILKPNADGATYTHVVDSVNMGTLNRGNNPVTHVYRDVVPYKIYGNVPQ